MTIGNKGIAYALQSRDDLAKDEINHAINMFVEMKNYYAISSFLSYMYILFEHYFYCSGKRGIDSANRPGDHRLYEADRYFCCIVV